MRAKFSTSLSSRRWSAKLNINTCRIRDLVGIHRQVNSCCDVSHSIFTCSLLTPCKLPSRCEAEEKNFNNSSVFAPISISSTFSGSTTASVSFFFAVNSSYNFCAYNISSRTISRVIYYRQWRWYLFIYYWLFTFMLACPNSGLRCAINRVEKIKHHHEK